MQVGDNCHFLGDDSLNQPPSDGMVNELKHHLFIQFEKGNGESVCGRSLTKARGY